MVKHKRTQSTLKEVVQTRRKPYLSSTIGATEICITTRIGWVFILRSTPINETWQCTTSAGRGSTPIIQNVTCNEAARACLKCLLDEHYHTAMVTEVGYDENLTKVIERINEVMGKGYEYALLEVGMM